MEICRRLGAILAQVIPFLSQEVCFYSLVHIYEYIYAIHLIYALCVLLVRMACLHALVNELISATFPLLLEIN